MIPPRVVGALMLLAIACKRPEARRPPRTPPVVAAPPTAVAMDAGVAVADAVADAGSTPPRPDAGDATTDTPAAAIVADRAVRAAFSQLRRDVLGEGLHPEVDGIYGCSGSGATHCVETAWLDLAVAFAGYAQAHCGDDPAVRAALADYEHALAASERAMAAMRAALNRDMERPGPRTEERLRASELRATEANQLSAERAGTALVGCPRGERYRAVAEWLPTRNTEAIPRWPRASR